MIGEGAKILFLDMDGVLNSEQSSHYFGSTKYHKKTFMNGFDELCPIACSNLNYLLETSDDIRVVISSTWRRFHELSEFEEMMKDRIPAIVGKVVDKTPVFKPEHLSARVERGDEIYHWLEMNDALKNRFVVLDDDSDMDKVKTNFIHIDNQIGLTIKDVRVAAGHLGVSLK